MNSDQKDSKSNKDKSPGNYPTFVKYIGLSFQLFAIIGGGTWLGWWIQQRSDMEFPVWILFFSFLSVFIAFYQLWLSIKRDG
jgi:hypothetical protein